MELACVIVSAITAIFSAITAYLSYKNTKLISEGSIELEIREMITEAKNKILEYNGDNPKIFDALCEELLNAYDEACVKYIDNKVDRKRFRKTYIHEITQIVENEPYKKILSQKDCNFEAIIEVYRTWIAH